MTAKKGKTYYARRRGAQALITVRVLDVTRSTVLICGTDPWNKPERYEHGWIDFIEEVTHDPAR